MTVAEYLVSTLIKYGVNDVFGIPGGVLLKCLHAFDECGESIQAHINYHEQMSGFAACGYSQTKGRLGLAYATRGPGITNMYTCIAEAYQESIPVVFLTAHSAKNDDKMRFEHNQEIDLSLGLKSITKMAEVVDDVVSAKIMIDNACKIAMSGRKGPVFLDINSKLWEEMIDANYSNIEVEVDSNKNYIDIKSTLEQKLNKSKRPLILIGDGIRQAGCTNRVDCLKNINIPIISSRGSQDICSQFANYYGYIGSHGCRYSNFILAKADLVISIGNRMAFPVNSKSFAPIFDNKELIRIDIDEREFLREIKNSTNIRCDIKDILNLIDELEINDVSEEWTSVCDTIYENLKEEDISEPVMKLVDELFKMQDDTVFVSDVGNNEFWFSRAFEYVRPKGEILCSKSFGTLGNALGRAIGAYYATKKSIVCIIGDQGFQYNIQELQYIKQWNLPIIIIVMNNECSSMIRDHEVKMYRDWKLHIDKDSGYETPSFKKIADAYGIRYSNELNIDSYIGPLLCEINFDKMVKLTPDIPRGNPCQKMVPEIDGKLYNKLELL